jgi:hypothetical protein
MDARILLVKTRFALLPAHDEGCEMRDRISLLSSPANAIQPLGGHTASYVRTLQLDAPPSRGTTPNLL